MWLPSIALGRLLAFVAVGLAAVAVALGRHNPGPPEVRYPATPRHRPIRDVLFPDTVPGLRLLDAETGAVGRFPLVGTPRIEYAACSPWRDGQGRAHVAGLWKELDGTILRGMGLARCTLPGGEVLDRIKLEVFPVSAPCWPPTMRAWVLYAGSDGLLYRLSFEEAARVPRSLTWRCPPPWGGHLAIEEPTWPTDPRLAATIVVSLRPVRSDRRPPAWVDSELWWLKLDADGAAIEGAGRLIAEAPAGGNEEIVAERLPALSAIPDGGLALAYLARRRGESGHRLRLAPVTINASTGAPRVDGAAAVEVAGGRAYSTLAFSGDGRWLYSFPDRSPVPMRAERSNVVDALAGRPGPTPLIP